MLGRGLRAPVLVISDGGAGLIAGVERVSRLGPPALSHPPGPQPPRPGPQARPSPVQGRVLGDLGRHRRRARRRGGPGGDRAKAFAAKWAKLYPTAMEILEADFEHLTTYLRFPKEHWHRIRHSFFIERTFGETRRRVKVIGRLPGERSCLSLVWAVLDRASAGWRGVEMTPKVVRQLQQLRRELVGPPASPIEPPAADTTAQTVTAAT